MKMRGYFEGMDFVSDEAQTGFTSGADTKKLAGESVRASCKNSINLKDANDDRLGAKNTRRVEATVSAGEV